MKDNDKCSGLFAHTLKKLRITAGIGIVLYVILCLVVLIANNIDISMSVEKEILTVGYAEAAEALVVIPLFFTPVMMIVSFGFVNTRAGSDFYFSMPAKRTKMYLQIIGAVLLEALIMMLSAGFTACIGSLFLKYVNVDVMGLFKGIIQTVASCIFVCGVFAIGISLTGNIAANLVVSLLVMTVPRAIVTAFAYIINVNLVFGYGSFSILYIVNSNTLMRIFFQVVDGTLDFSIFAELFTCAEGVLYLLLGGLIFKKRKSETAGKSSVSKGVNTAFGMAVPFIIGLVGDNFILRAASDDEGEKMTFIFFAVLMYVIAVLVYLIYELVSSRKWKNVAKGVARLPILAALVAASLGIMFLCVNAGNNYAPEEEKVRYVSVHSSYEWNRDVTIRDDETIKMICDAYKKQKSMYEGWAEYAYARVDVKIGDGIFGHRRAVWMTENDRIKLARAEIKADPELVNDYLPPEKGNVFIMDRDIEAMTGASAAEYYKMAYDELKENGKREESILDYYRGCRIVALGAGKKELWTDGSYISVIDRWYYRKLPQSDVQGYTGAIYLSESTPKTLKTLLDAFWEKNGEIKFSDVLARKNKMSDSVMYSFTGFDDAEHDEGLTYHDCIEGELTQKLKDILDRYDYCGDPEAENTLFVRLYGFVGAYNLSPADAEMVRQMMLE